MKKIKFFFTFFVLLSFSTGINATTIHYDLGPMSPDHFLYDYEFGHGTVIDDIYLFDIAPGTTLSILSTTATSAEIGTSFGISDFAFSLTDSTGMLMSDWGSAGDNIDFMHTVSGGHYGVHFTGIATGTHGGIVSGITSIAPIPVPAATWLFGSALFSLLGISRSRKSKV